MPDISGQDVEWLELGVDRSDLVFKLQLEDGTRLALYSNGEMQRAPNGGISGARMMSNYYARARALESDDPA